MSLGKLKKSKQTFLDNTKNISFEKADVALLGIGIDVSASYAKGTAKAPEAIIQASHQIEFEPSCFEKKLSDLIKIHNAGILEFKSSEKFSLKKKILDEMVNKVKEFSNKALEQNKLIILFGGEHSISNGVFQAIAEKINSTEVTIIQFDAHLDLRKSYENLKYSHASIMRNALDLNFNAIQLGIRDVISKEEIDFIVKSRIKENIFYCPTMPSEYYEKFLKKQNWIAKENIFWDCKVNENQIKAICSKIKTKFAFISFDVDCLDCSIMPGTGTPLPHGLDLKSAEKILFKIIEFCNKNKIKLLGFDINEVMPLKENTSSEQIAALIVYKILLWNFIDRFDK